MCLWSVSLGCVSEYFVWNVSLERFVRSESLSVWSVEAAAAPNAAANVIPTS